MRTRAYGRAALRTVDVRQLPRGVLTDSSPGSLQLLTHSALVALVTLHVSVCSFVPSLRAARAVPLTQLNPVSRLVDLQEHSDIFEAVQNVQVQSRIVARHPSDANQKEYRDRFEALLQLADGRMPRDFLFAHLPAVLLTPSFKDIITARREAIKPAGSSSSSDSSSGSSDTPQQPTEPDGD